MSKEWDSHKRRLALIGGAGIEVNPNKESYQKVNGSEKTFTLQKVVPEVDSGAFDDYENLEELVVGNPKIKMGDFALAACKNLKNIKIETNGQKVDISDWNNSITKDIQLGDGCFGGCVSLDIKNLPPKVGPFYQFHFEGIQCYAEVEENGVKRRIKIDNWKYTTIPENKHREILYYMAFFATMPFSIPEGTLVFLRCHEPLPEMDLEIVYDKNDTKHSSPEIILKKIKNEKWNKEGIPSLSEVQNISWKDLCSKLKEQLGDYFKDYDEKEIEEELVKIYKQLRNGGKAIGAASVFPIIPPFVTQIGSGAFDDWTCIEELVIPDHINKIEKGAFTNCKNLKKVHVPKDVTVIEDGAFSDDTEVVLY